MIPEVINMKDDKKQSLRQEKTSKWRKFAKKRWIYPAVYLGFAALVVAAVLWMQSGDELSIDQPKENDSAEDSFVYDGGEESVPVTQSTEVIKWPVENKDAVHISKQFYDAEASAEEQEAALVYYNNTYRPSTGINIKSESGENFAVTAAMSGQVVQAEKDSLVGNKVKIDHGNNVVTLYTSLKDLAVEKGDKVKQGQKLGMAGRNTYNKDAGIHAHFEIRKNNEALNPVTYFDQSIADLPDTQKQESVDKSTSEEQNDAEDQEQSTESEDSAGNEMAPSETGSNDDNPDAGDSSAEQNDNS
jgi:stage II sporulation protein Q